jgi:hypothetical protein
LWNFTSFLLLQTYNKRGLVLNIKLYLYNRKLKFLEKLVNLKFYLYKRKFSQIRSLSIMWSWSANYQCFPDLDLDNIFLIWSVLDLAQQIRSDQIKKKFFETQIRSDQSSKKLDQENTEIYTAILYTKVRHRMSNVYD